MSHRFLLEGTEYLYVDEVRTIPNLLWMTLADLQYSNQFGTEDDRYI